MDDDKALQIFSSYAKSSSYLPFDHVRFVPATKASSSEEEPAYKVSYDTLSGEEASTFYNAVISTASTSDRKSQVLSVLNKTPAHVKVDSGCSSLTKGKVKLKDFFFYVQEGNVEEVLECINAKGCSPNDKDDYGWTALMIAACAGHEAVVKCLLKKGADCDMCNPQGLTALDLAKKQNVSSTIQNMLHPMYRKVINIKVEKSDDCKGPVVQYCEICKKNYEDAPDRHTRTICHLFNSGKSKYNNRTFYHIPESNRGFQLMLKDGWDKEKGLGPSGEGQKYPVKTVLKKNRSCIGRVKKEIARITHFQPYDTSAVQNQKNHAKVTIRHKTVRKRDREKIERRNRRKEINFRREFYNDNVLL